MRGEDVVVGAIQEKRSAEIEALLRHFEFVPPLMPGGPAAVDTARIIKRHPRVCVIDPLAWQNPEGSRNPSRWQDIEELLENGISVLTSLNVQYIDELKEQARTITGKAPHHTVPRAFVATADDIEIVDAPPDLLAARIGEAQELHGDQQQVLSKMRELALLAAAEIVDDQLDAYLLAHGVAAKHSPQERILICLTPMSNAAEMIASAKRTQELLHGELWSLYVRQPDLSPEARSTIDGYLRLVREAGAEIAVVNAANPIRAILDFAQEKRITQIYLGHSRRSSWRDRLFGNPVDRLIRQAKGIDVHIFPL